MFFNRLVEAPGVLVLILRSLLALARGRRGLALSILPPAVTAALLAATVLALSATPVRAQDSTPTVVPEISLNAKFRGYNPFNWPGGGVFWAGDDVVVILTRCDPATGDCSGFLAPELAVTLEVVTQDPLTDADTERRDVSVTFAADEYTAEARVPTTAATEPRARYWLKVNLREAAGYTINAREQVLSGELHAPFPQTVSITADADTVSEGEDAQFTLKRCVHPIIGIDHIARSACFDEGLPDLTVDVTVTGEGQTIDGTPPAQVTFAAGSATASLAVPTATDDLDEDTLAVTAAIAAPGAGNNAYELGVPASAAVQVANTPPVLPEISLKAKFGGYDTISWSGGDVFWAGDDVLLTLTRCDPTTGECSGFLAPELAVTLEVVTQDLLTDAVTERRDVSVTFAADEYTAEARVPTTAATEPRARYWLKVILQEAAGYTINARKQGMSGEVHAPFPQTVSITADADTVSEGEDARFTLKRCVHPILGIDLINRSACFDQGLPDLTVDVTVTGEGQTIDGTPPAQVTFAAGSATASLTMPTATDDLYEDTLAVTAAIAAPGAGNNAYELGDPANAAVQVANTTPLPTISSNPAAGNEADGAIEFHVSLSPVSAVPATLAYATSDATAKAGEDYTAAAGTLTFEPGVTSQTIRVEVTEDYLHEPDETFYITLSNPRGAQHIYEAFQGRIRANPVSTVTITGPEAVVEGETVTVTLTRTQTQGGLDVNLGYTNGSDAQFSGTPPATARFEHGRSETTATFATVDNPRLLPIGEENSVLVGLNRGDGYTVGSAGQEFLFITVTDNDVPAVSIETAAGYSPSGWTKYPVIWAGDDAVFTLKRCDPSTGECGGFVAPALTVNLLRRIVHRYESS